MARVADAIAPLSALGSRLSAETSVPRAESREPRAEVSIVICTRNRPALLRRCLASIAAGTTLPLEVVVSDDGDDIESTAAAVCAEFAFARCVAGPRRGIGANRRHGAAAARAPYVSFLDDDVVVPASFVARLAALAARAERSGGRTIYSGVVVDGDEVVRPSNQTFWGHFGAPVPPNGRLENINLCANLVPAAAFRVAAFDERLFCYEDADFCAQARAAGFRVELDDALTSTHLPVERAPYSRHLTRCRFYATLKRHLLVERRPLRALAYLVLAPLHQAAHHARRGEWGAVPTVVRDLALALGDLRAAVGERLAKAVA